jgi:hypothetical protein
MQPDVAKGYRRGAGRGSPTKKTRLGVEGRAAHSFGFLQAEETPGSVWGVLSPGVAGF